MGFITSLIALMLKIDTLTILMIVLLFVMTIVFIGATSWAIKDDTRRGGK